MRAVVVTYLASVQHPGVTCIVPEAPSYTRASGPVDVHEDEIVANHRSVLRGQLSCL
jgi:hypothetical protein